ncbi:MAG: hypothetical protein Q4F57_09120 [Weeksellaceae bacterium]|nr:hypothetical protein [Weeksellaceae bacterium]
MKHILLAFFLISLTANAQSAAEIVNRHIEATGGIQNWNNLNSIRIKGIVSMEFGESVDILIEHRRPYLKRVSFINGGQEQLSEGYDGTNAYTYNPVNGRVKALTPYTPDPFETDLLNYESKGFTVELQGREIIDGRETYKIVLTKNTNRTTYWFDSKNYHLLKEENKDEVVRYSQVKKVGDLYFSHRIEARPHGGREYVLEFHQITPNAGFSPKRFEFK